MAFPDLVATAGRAALQHLGGEAVIYAPGEGDPVTVTGIFDASYTRVESGTGDVESVGPAVWVVLDDLPTDPEEDDPILTIAGKTYTVAERQRDGLGTIRLLLHRADL
jgi:hypothetical protein